MNASRSRTSMIYVILIMVIVFAVVGTLNSSQDDIPAVTLNDVAVSIMAGRIDRIIQENDRLQIEYSDQSRPIDIVYKEPQDTFLLS